jgi:hypothetical protein
MQHKVKDLREVPLDELPLHGGPPTDMEHYSVLYEFQRRQTKTQIKAAQGALLSADYAKKSVRWMAVSVVVLTLASIGSFVLDLLTYWRGWGG